MTASALFVAMLVLSGDGKPDALRRCTVSEVVGAFQFNDALADDSFLNRRIEVTGSVLRIQRVAAAPADPEFVYRAIAPVSQPAAPHEAGKPLHAHRKIDGYVVLFFENVDVGAGWQDVAVRCEFDASARARLARLRAPQSPPVIIRGVCRSFSETPEPFQFGPNTLDACVLTLSDCEIVEDDIAGEPDPATKPPEPTVPSTKRDAP